MASFFRELVSNDECKIDSTVLGRIVAHAVLICLTGWKAWHDPGSVGLGEYSLAASGVEVGSGVVKTGRNYFTPPAPADAPAAPDPAQPQ